MTVFPVSSNISKFKPIDCIAFGIGPLSFNTDYMKEAEKPNPALSGGLKFLAKQMKVDIAPLPILTPQEYNMLKDFCARHPQPKTANI